MGARLTEPLHEPEWGWGEPRTSSPGALIDENYLKLIRLRPCWFCNSPGPSDPHHIRGRGTGSVKRNDFGTMPLCRDCHSRLGNIGLARMLERYNLQPEELADWVARQVANYFLAKEGERPF